MKFMNLKIDELEDFFEIVNKCKGDVYLESPDMRLNLKSNLCKYISLAKLCSADQEYIKELEVFAEDKEDAALLFRFMCGGRI